MIFIFFILLGLLHIKSPNQNSQQTVLKIGQRLRDDIQQPDCNRAMPRN